MKWRNRKPQDFREEIEAHLQLEADRLRSEGVASDEARSAARRAFGNTTAAEERFYESRKLAWLRHLAQDLRYAGRLLRKSPGFTLACVLVLALGTGANTAVFSVVNAVLLNAAPYKQPDRLFRVFQRPQGQTNMPAAPANYVDWQSQSQSFRSMAAFSGSVYRLNLSGQIEKAPGARVSADFFETLGVQPIFGRAFSREDDRPGGARVAVISHAFWSAQLASDPNVVGRQLILDGESYSIVGVMPARFAYPSEQSAIWTPLGLGSTERSRSRTENYLGVIARLQDGVTAAQAQLELDAIAARLAAAYPNSNERLGVAIKPLREHTVGSVRPALLTLLGAVAFVMLIAGANFSNLLLARNSARRRELAVRVSLGAGRSRIVRQLLVESAFLAMLGGAGGWLLAQATFPLLVRFIPGSVPFVSRIQLDNDVFWFTATVSLAAGLFFGLLPALDAARHNLSEGLQQGARTSPSVRPTRFRDGLIAAEVALTTILLVGAGLMVRTMMELYSGDPGFNPDRLLAVRVNLSLPQNRDAGTPDAEAREAIVFYELIGRVAALPGVREAGAISSVPFTYEYTGTRFMIEGVTVAASERVPEADYSVITPGYFRTMGIPLLRGRSFTDADGRNGSPVGIINEAMARHFFAGRDPIGLRIRRGGRDSTRPWITIVGVVGNIRHLGLDTPPVPELFFPHAQTPWPELTLMVRTAADPASLMAPLRGLVRELGPNNDLGTPRTAEQLLASSVSTRRFAMQLLSLFAVLAFVLAGVGIYGAVSFSVSQRTQEIGVRIALGATSREVAAMVVRRSALPLGLGAVVGAGSSMGITRLMTNLLYGVKPYDAVSFAVALVFLLVVAVGALYGPARRAARTDPVVALRCE